MRPFTFIHTADCHLDTPFAGVGREDPALAARLRGMQREVFDDLITLCLEREAAFLVVAGDLYDAQERSLTTRVRLRDAFRRLETEGIQVFLATGNHDNLAETQRGLESLPPNVHVFSAERPEQISWPEEDPVASITGLSYDRRAIDENLALLFPRPSESLFSVAVLHCNVDGDPGHDNYAPCRLDDLFHSGYSYWALGHIHERRVLAEGPVTVVYPGCLQGRQIRETGEKGATVVEVDEQGVARVAFAPLDRVRWVVAEVDASEVDSDEDLAERLQRHAEERVAKLPPRVQTLVVRWRLTGRLACDPAAVGRVLEMLRERASETHPFVWPESIETSRTVPPVDLAEVGREESPRGDLVREVDRLRADAARLEELRGLLLDRSGPAELIQELKEDRESRREPEPPIEEILDEALWLGVERLSQPRQ